MRATVVVDLGFGDAGKGLLTDHLVRTTGARLVVRYNGGAQAGHNVVTPDGRHHTFSQLGSGTFVDGVDTFLARPVVVHPTALLREAEVLEAKGVTDPLGRLAVSSGARVVTPYLQALGRLRELARGAARHGSCGVGIGETVGDALDHPEDAVVAADLSDAKLLAEKLHRQRERARQQAAGLAAALAGASVASSEVEGSEAQRELAILHRREVAETWMRRVAALAERVKVLPDAALAERLRAEPEVIFEGAQGVLLDEWHGFHPHTTWSTCTPEPARAHLADAAPDAEVRVLGVLRSHAVRHGAGPLPTEDASLAGAVREHNRTDPWQGPVRYGWFDAVLARYALQVAGPVDALALTHLDLPPRLPEWRLADAYVLPAGANGDLAEIGDDGKTCRQLSVTADHDLTRQQRLTRLLNAVRPRYEHTGIREEAVLASVEASLGRKVDLVSRGPRAADVSAR